MGEADFLEALAKDPSLISKLQKQDELNAFKKDYNVGRATPLKCPACGAYLQYPGTLWFHPLHPTHFVCRKCKLDFEIKCNTVENILLIEELRRVVKGEGILPSWIKRESEP